MALRNDINADGAHTHSLDIAQFTSGTNNPSYIIFNFIIKY